MILDFAIYPRVSLPLGLRARIMWGRALQFFASHSAEGGADARTLEMEFRELVARENATISKICFSYSGSVAEFDDLRQDALINIWRGMRAFRHEAPKKTWIYRVTVNSCLSTIRGQIKHRHEDIDGLYGLIDSDDASKEAIEQMHRIVGSLGAQEKAIIMMWLDEFSYEEIASTMGLNRNTVATKIKRIKEKITKEYKKSI